MGGTVGRAMGLEQKDTTGSEKGLSHLSCFIWLVEAYMVIHPFFPSVDKDV